MVMMIKYKGKVFFAVITGSVSLLISSVGYAEQNMDDGSLASADQFAKLTPMVIASVKTVSKQPIEEQKIAHEQVANIRTGEMIQDNLQSTVLTTHENQKKEENKGLNGEKTAYIPSRYRTVSYGISAQNNNVRVETAEHITIYVSRENFK